MLLFVKSKKYLYNLIGLVVLFFVIMVVNFNQSFVENNLDKFAAKLWKISSIPYRYLRSIESFFVSHNDLILANNTLKLQQQMMQAKIYRLSALQKQNKQLRQLLSSSKDLGGDFIVAQLLVVLKKISSIEIIINKGKKYDLYLGQPVLDGFGVVGQVVGVYDEIARVQLLTDQKSAIPVQVANSGIRAIIRGTGKFNELDLIDISQPEKLHLGDLLLTSALGLQFNAGYPVGVVKAIDKIANNNWIIKVTPTAHLNSNNNFLLVWPEHSHWLQSLQRLNLS
jgi:rod shape-determining protein MreC